MSGLEIDEPVTAAPLLLLEPDRNQLEQFFGALFRYRGGEGFISFRSFFDNEISSKPFRIEAVPVDSGFKYLCDVAEDHARRAANEPKCVVFCPPIAVFSNKEHAAEMDLLAGLALSVECDQHPVHARARLERILGPATVVVRSGGEWQQAGRLPQDKLHLHFRLTRAAQGKEDLAKLKRLRRLAVRLAAGDASNVPIVHPIRWPGSWHRKREPRLCEIAALEPDREIDLDAAIAALEAALPQERQGNGFDAGARGNDGGDAVRPDWAELTANIVAGKDLHQSTMRLAASYIGSGMTAAAALRQLQSLMLASTVPHDERWKARFADLPRLVNGAQAKYGSDGQNAKARADEQSEEPPESEELPENEAQWLAKLNDKYYVIQDGGKIDVLTFERQAQRIGNYEHVRHVPAFLTFQAFRNKYLNRPVFIPEKGGEIRAVPLGSWWLKHPQRRQYDGLIFQPGGGDVIAGRLNLWKGWGVAPKPGDWSLMREHIRTVLAADSNEAFVYVLNWLAFAVQNPGQPAEVALAFKGKRGTGKGTLGNTMVRLFGQHGVHLSDAKHLAGHFNAHLRNACLLFADEAYWPGDKSAEGNLKRLITEPDLAIEGKGRDIVTVPNMLHVIMGSNEDWVAPAGEHERRFAINNVTDCHLQDKNWFGAIYAQLDNGGYAAMLYDLLNHDISGWHPRQIWRNSALLEQQQLSLDPLDSWWVELLEGGVLEGADPNFPGHVVSNSYEREISGTDSYGSRRTRHLKQPGL
jgi:hypothetical protein